MLLEYELGGQLHHTHLTGRCQLAKGTVGEYTIRISKVRSVGHIEELKSRLQLVSFGEAKLLEYGSVKILVCRAANEISTRRARSAALPIRAEGGKAKGFDVEVIRRSSSWGRWRRPVRIADQVRPHSGASTDTGSANHIDGRS